MPFSLAQSKKFIVLAFVLTIIFITLLIIWVLASGTFNQSKRLARNLPYFTPEFTIVYSSEKDQIYVNVLKPPYEANRQKALTWLQTQGANPTKLNIIFYAPINKFR